MLGPNQTDGHRPRKARSKQAHSDNNILLAGLLDSVGRQVSPYRCLLVNHENQGGRCRE
jgi:hypothetical protein